MEGWNARQRRRGHGRHGVQEFVIGDVLTHIWGFVDIRDR